jgi:V8-like Glu-specific endopeptidase
MSDFLDERKKTVVFLGEINEKQEKQFCATGVLVIIQGIFHLITAKHVILDANKKYIDSKLNVFFNLKDGKTGSRSIVEMKNKSHTNWIFHQNEKVDIAIIPIWLDPQNDDVKAVPDNMFQSVDNLSELYDVFFLSYQPGVQNQSKIAPIARNGIISLINDDKTFYIDGSAFPGNSGSPVFVKPSVIFEKGSFVLGDNTAVGNLLE